MQQRYSGDSLDYTCTARDADTPTWIGTDDVSLPCAAQSCDTLTVSSSDTTGQTGTTTDVHTVICSDGYSDGSIEYTCSARDADTPMWVGTGNTSLICAAKFCATLTASNSDTSGRAGTTTDVQTANPYDAPANRPR